MRLIHRDESIQCAFESLHQAASFEPFYPSARIGRFLCCINGFAILLNSRDLRILPKNKIHRKGDHGMKITYLIKKETNSGDASLIEVTKEEWLEIIKQNENLPKDQQRYFIRDVITEGSDLDVMVMESSEEQYKEWYRDRHIETRNCALRKEFEILSLDAPIPDGDDLILADELLDPPKTQNAYLFTILLSELRDSLSKWRPWGESLLDMYLNGERRSCTSKLSKICGVSLQTARRYKREFELYIRTFCEHFFI